MNYWILFNLFPYLENIYVQALAISAISCLSFLLYVIYKETYNDVLMKIHKLTHDCYGDHNEVRQIQKLLIKHPNAINTPLFSKSYTPFLRACRNNCLPLIKFMLENGADIDAKTTDGTSCVFLVAYFLASNQSTDYRSIEFLKKNDCDLNAQKALGHTALFIAAKYGDIKLIKWLLKKGANPEVLADDGSSAADHALIYGFPEAESLLRSKP